MLKIRRPLGRLIFNMGITIPGKTVFLIETAPRFFFEMLLEFPEYQNSRHIKPSNYHYYAASLNTHAHRHTDTDTGTHTHIPWQIWSWQVAIWNILSKVWTGCSLLRQLCIRCSLLSQLCQRCSIFFQVYERHSLFSQLVMLCHDSDVIWGFRPLEGVCRPRQKFGPIRIPKFWRKWAENLKYAHMRPIEIPDAYP